MKKHDRKPKITRESAIGRIAARFRQVTGEHPTLLEESIRIYHIRVHKLRLTDLARADRDFDLVHDVCGILGTFGGSTHETWTPRFGLRGAKVGEVRAGKIVSA